MSDRIKVNAEVLLAYEEELEEICCSFAEHINASFDALMSINKSFECERVLQKNAESIDVYEELLGALSSVKHLTGSLTAIAENYKETERENKDEVDAINRH